MLNLAEILKETCEKCGAPSMVNHIEIKWNNRFTRRMGCASYNRITQKGLVELSTPIFARAPYEEQYATVVHEICHILANHLFPYGVLKPHGWQWKSLMYKCGLRPERCHDIDISDLKRNVKRIEYVCNCEASHKITPHKDTKIQRGAVYRCVKCKTVIKRKGAQ